MVAAWCMEMAAAFGLETSLQQITFGKIHIEPDKEGLYIFTLPTHGFTAPWLMIKTMLSLAKGKGERKL